MSVIVVLDNSFSMGFVPHINNIKLKEDNYSKQKSSFFYAKKGLVAFFKTMRKVSIDGRLCLLTSSPKLSLQIQFTTKINKIIKKLLSIDICSEMSSSQDFFDNIDQYICNDCKLDEKIHVIIVTDILGAEIESQSEYPLKSSLDRVSTTIIRNLASLVAYLYPPLNPEIVASGTKENGTFLINAAGFLDEEDVIFPVVETKHVVICRSPRVIDDFAPNILYLLQSCLHRQKSYCLVSVGRESRYGLLFCAKKKTQHNLILFLLPKDQFLPWLGPWEQLGSSSDLPCKVYSVGQDDTETSPFPIIEGIECSYFDSEIQYLLKKPNIEDFEKLKNMCQLYAIPEIYRGIMSVKSNQ
ncbi:hypothetical protein MXB_72, partial [Myxobolus squamalis]